MKLTTLLIFIGVLNISASVYSQDIPISVNLQNGTLSDLFNIIEKKTEYKIFYKSSLINENQKVSIIADLMPVNEVLVKALAGKNLTYDMVDKVIVITPSETAVQQSKVTGTISDGTTGEPLIGVSIIVEGTTQGTISDANGKFSIDVQTSSGILTFSYIGYLPERITLAGKNTLEVKLIPDIQKLEEVVVIGYGTQKKADVTSSVTTVKTKDFLQGSVQDLGQLIQGKVAGLTIYSVSGDPTANTEIKLRGNSTLTGTSSNPLILIDGVPGDFNSVAPGDIESFDVLKDGSAAAIYGTKGTNGVIIITTKRASGRNINTVEYAGYATTQSIAKKLDMSTAADVRTQIVNGYRASTDDKGANTDWLKEITRTPISHVHNLTFRGGSDKTNYLFNVNYKDVQGIFLKSNNKVANVRADINHSMFNDLVKINIGAITRYTNYACTGDGVSFNGYDYRQALIYNPTAPVTKTDGSWYEEPGQFNYDNPVSRLKESDGLFTSQWSRINGSVTVQPIRGLLVKGLISYSRYNEERGYYETKQNISTVRGGLNGYASNGTKETSDRLSELTAEYSKILGDHHLSMLAGYSYSDNTFYEFWQKNVDFPTDLFGFDQIGLGKGIKDGDVNAGIYSNKTATNLIAYFGRGTYNFKDKYLFMGSLRYEAASQLVGTKNPWGFFPAVSVGWRISNESFMKDFHFISDLKLRAGYGVTGTQPSALFLGVATLGYSGYFYSDGQWKHTLAPARNPNPLLRWEEKRETNIGLDYGFLGGRINGNIDIYKRNINGLLLDYTVPTPPNLVDHTLANVGKMENKGIEILVNIIPVRTKDIEWTTSFNFSTNTNKLITLSNDLYKNEAGFITAGAAGEPIQTYTHRLDVGGKVGNFYGYKVVDISTDGRWIYQDKAGNRVNSVDFVRGDENKMVLGNGLPKWYAGWNNNLRYKKFDLGVSMRGAFGFQLLNFDRMYLENTKTVQYNRLRSAYDKVFGKAVLSTAENLEFNSYYIENGDYWKIDNITLGYNFAFQGIKFIKSARLYISSLNTLTITKYKGIDPEVNISNLDPGSDYRDKYPTTRSFTIGFNANF